MILRRLLRSRRGSSAVEFAVVIGPLMMLLMGGVEAGNIAYTRSALEGALRAAARMATTGKYSSADIDAYVRQQMGALGIPASAVAITRRSYATFDSVGKPEPLTSDVAPFGGTPGKGDCYIDLNGDGQWSADAGLAGDGSSEDILYYGVTVDYKLLFDMTGSALGATNGVVKLSANTVVKNEPYGEAGDPPVNRCIA